MAEKWTPGPWHIGVRQAERIVYDQTGWAIANATVYHGESDRDQVLANARLIAAAPEMYRALITAREWLFAAQYADKIGGEELERDLREINDAIAKARGEG